MKYSYGDSIKLVMEPQEFTKDSGKEILQYAVGGLMYTPASNDGVIDKILDGRFSMVKSIAVDLEDALGDDMVGFGMRRITENIGKIASAVKSGSFDYDNIPLIFIRVRKPDQMRQVANALGDNLKYISGFNAPKFDKYNCKEYVDCFKSIKQELETKTDKEQTLYLMPIIENKTAMYRQLRMDNLLYINDALREIQDNVLNIRVGGADFCSIFGIRRGIKDHIYDIGVVRSVLSDIVNVFGKSYVVSGPVWEYFENKLDTSDKRWEKGMKKEVYYDVLNGFIGKTVIHPSQIKVVVESLVVDNRDYMDAIGILGMNENTIGVKKGESGNRMSEVKTHTKWAKKIVSLSYVYGVKESEE